MCSVVTCLCKFIFIVLLLNPTLETSASNILFFHTSATASHRISIWPLATKLADSGYNVTYIFPITKRPGSHPKIEELVPSQAIKMVEHFVGEFDINIRLNNTVNQWLKSAFEVMPIFCEAFYDSPEIKEWMSRPGLTYDLVLSDGAFPHCIYPLVHKFQAKHIIFKTITMPSYWDTFGVVPETSSIPELMFHQKPEKLLSSLWSRTVNTLAILVWKLAYGNTIRQTETILRKKMNLTDMPSFEEMDRQTSLVLHNTYFIEEYPMSLPPMFVSYSGMSCTKKSLKERKPLPQKLDAFINDTSTDGFVYVSFGSSIIASAMPEELRDQFMTAFAAFPKLKFLWRWTGAIPENTPKNVLLQPWLPQLDVLAHAKIKAFVMQAGRPSTQEALCYGVPMITMPIFGDQDFCSDRLESIGAATSLDIATLTSDKLVDALKQVVYENKYKERVKELSRMFRDRPMDPVEYVFYWVEYVLRHDTSLLKPLGMQQTWWQRRLLDVYILILFIVLTTMSITGFLMYKTVKIITGRVGFLSSSHAVKRKSE